MDFKVAIKWDYKGDLREYFRQGQGRDVFSSSVKKRIEYYDVALNQFSTASHSRKTTIRVTVIFSLVNTPRRLFMIYLTGRYQRFSPKQLLRLSGIIFVNSDKIQLWQHKVAPYKSKFWVLFGNFGFQKWSRKVCCAL